MLQRYGTICCWEIFWNMLLATFSKDYITSEKNYKPQFHLHYCFHYSISDLFIGMVNHLSAAYFPVVFILCTYFSNYFYYWRIYWQIAAIKVQANSGLSLQRHCYSRTIFVLCVGLRLHGVCSFVYVFERRGYLWRQYKFWHTNYTCVGSDFQSFFCLVPFSSVYL